MFPNAYLEAFWRPELSQHVFVAMSFDREYEDRYTDVLVPAIRSVRVGGVPLEPLRVDYRRRGEDILTEIVDGIVHAQLVVADVSPVAKGRKGGRPLRNGNVMYELGMAVACRQPVEVIVVRDDCEQLLFDASTIPHKQLDFGDRAAAIQTLQELMVSRLNERRLLNDARIQKALRGLAPYEVEMLEAMASMPPDKRLTGRTETGGVSVVINASVRNLIDQGMVKLDCIAGDAVPCYALTHFGTIVAKHIRELREQVRGRQDESESEDSMSSSGVKD